MKSRENENDGNHLVVVSNRKRSHVDFPYSIVNIVIIIIKFVT